MKTSAKKNLANTDLANTDFFKTLTGSDMNSFQPYCTCELIINEHKVSFSQR